MREPPQEGRMLEQELLNPTWFEKIVAWVIILMIFAMLVWGVYGVGLLIAAAADFVL